MADPLSDLPTERIVDVQSGLEVLVYLPVIDPAVLVGQDVPESDGCDERFRGFLVYDVFPTEHTNRFLGCVAIEAEISGGDVFGEIGTRLNRVLEHPLDGALFGRIAEDIITGEDCCFDFSSL